MLYLNFVYPSRLGKKPSMILWSQSHLHTKETLSVFFCQSMAKTAMDGRPLCREFRASERAGSGNFLFFGVGTVHLGGLESCSESLPSNRVAPNHSMIERK